MDKEAEFQIRKRERIRAGLIIKTTMNNNWQLNNLTQIPTALVIDLLKAIRERIYADDDLPE